MVMTTLPIIVSIFIPPVGVFMREGLGRRFWINCLLTLLGWLPGVIHAVYVLTSLERRPISERRAASLAAGT